MVYVTPGWNCQFCSVACRTETRTSVSNINRVTSRSATTLVIRFTWDTRRSLMVVFVMMATSPRLMECDGSVRVQTSEELASAGLVTS